MPLKSPEQAISAVLLSDPAVAAVVGQRIYPVLAPATADLPLVTWRRSGVQRQHTLSGPMGMPTVLLSVELFAPTYEAVRDLADRVRRALDGYGGSPADCVLVNNVSLDNETDGYVQLAGGDTPPVYSVSQTFSIMWSEI
jgi:hypothetical protein